MATLGTKREGGYRGARLGSGGPWAWLAFVLLALGCGGDGGTGPDPVDPALEPFVGSWEASSFELTNPANPTDFVDVMDGGSFSLNVQPSGQYTAILSFPDLPTPGVEIGQLSVIGTSVRLSPQGGQAATSSFEFDGADRLILDGPTEFDWNRDLQPDPAEAYIVLERTGA
jgi:hypothetical protein